MGRGECAECRGASAAICLTSCYSSFRVISCDFVDRFSLSRNRRSTNSLEVTTLARQALCRCARIPSKQPDRRNLRFMAEADSAPTENQTNEEITYQAVEKDGVVTAIWEMKGRKHLRTIDPRSRQGREILNLYTTEEVDHPASEAAATS